MSYTIISSLSYYLHTKSTNVIANTVKMMILTTFNTYMIRNGKEEDMIRIAALHDPVYHNLLSSNDKHAAELYIIREVKSNLKASHSLFSLLRPPTSKIDF